MASSPGQRFREKSCARPFAKDSWAEPLSCQGLKSTVQSSGFAVDYRLESAVKRALALQADQSLVADCAIQREAAVFLSLQDRS